MEISLILSTNSQNIPANSWKNQNNFLKIPHRFVEYFLKNEMYEKSKQIDLNSLVIMLKF